MNATDSMPAEGVADDYDRSPILDMDDDEFYRHLEAFAGTVRPTPARSDVLLIGVRLSLAKNFKHLPFVERERHIQNYAARTLACLIDSLTSANKRKREAAKASVRRYIGAGTA